MDRPAKYLTCADCEQDVCIVCTQAGQGGKFTTLSRLHVVGGVRSGARRAFLGRAAGLPCRFSRDLLTGVTLAGGGWWGIYMHVASPEI